MVGSLDPGTNPVRWSGEEAVSGNGTHFIFGSKHPYRADGNNDTSDVTIYGRNLQTGVTQIVSKDTTGDNLTCVAGAGESTHRAPERGRPARRL